MCTCELEFCFGVVKAASRLPVRGVVAPDTIAAQFTLVFVFVTRNAGTREAQEGAVEILHLDQIPIGRSDLFGVVATVTRQPRVFAVENEAGFAVIKACLGWLPMDQRKVGAIVFRMTLRTCTVPIGRIHDRRVQPAFLLKPARNFLVTVDTPECRSACGNSVTLDAACRAIEIPVKCGERSRRNLRPHRARQQQRHEKQAQTDVPWAHRTRALGDSGDRNQEPHSCGTLSFPTFCY